ncbi:MAG: alkaline phosphatase family protein, partial [Anaerolineales bacterium]
MPTTTEPLSPTPAQPSATAPPSTLTPTPTPLVPQFEHIVLILFENKEFGSVIGNPTMPLFNRLARDYTLLTQYYAVRHPSLPNYIALIGGDTFGIHSDCNDCFVDAPSLPDLIEASGRTWKTYQEDMPKPCYLGGTLHYAQKHNPFVYFDPIRLDQERCERSVVPLTDLSADIQAGVLPNFIFITPNLCNDAHDCPLRVADGW